MAKPQSLGEVLRAGRLSRGISAGQLAEKLDRSKASIRSWERDETEPPPDDIERLVELLDLDPAALNHADPSADAAEATRPEPPDEDAERGEPAGAVEAQGDATVAEESDAASPEAERDPSDEPEPLDSDAKDAGAAVFVTTGDASNASGDVEMATGDLEAGAMGDIDGADDPEAIPEMGAASDEEGGLGPGVEVDAEADTVAHPIVPIPARNAAGPGDEDGLHEPNTMSGSATAAFAEAKPSRLRRFFAALRDPERPWLGYIRAFLTIVALVALGWAFVWAVRELFAAIGDLRGTESEGVDALVFLLVPRWST